MKQEPLNEEGERGIIVMVSSVAGLDGSTSAYGPSKGKGGQKSMDDDLNLVILLIPYAS